MVFKNIFCVYLLLIFGWQSYLAFVVKDFVNLFKGFGEISLAIEFLKFSQILVWLFACLTLFLVWEIYRRKELLLVNTFLISLILTISTIFLQMLIIVSAYFPVVDSPN